MPLQEVFWGAFQGGGYRVKKKKKTAEKVLLEGLKKGFLKEATLSYYKGTRI